MYYATTYAQALKNKVQVSLVTTDGEVFEGAFFVAGEQRVKDLLNGPDCFLPFMVDGGEVYLINRAAIARVVPRGHQPGRGPQPLAAVDQSSDNIA